MHKQLNRLGPTESGPITDRRSKNWTFSVSLVLLPAHGAGAGLQRLPVLAWPVWSHFRWTPAGLPLPGTSGRHRLALGFVEQPIGPGCSLLQGTRQLFLTVHSLGFRALTLCLQHHSLLSGRRADRMTCPNTGLVSQTCSDGMWFPHNENTWAFVQRASGKLPRSCICPLIYTLQNKADPQESNWIYKRWVGCTPSPNPCLLLILRNNRGCSHLPKTPSPEKEGGKAASWLNKAETPVCQKLTDVDRHSTAAEPSAQHASLGWFGVVTN